MSGVKSNTKFKCNGCGTICDFPDIPRPCPNCNGRDWDQLVIERVCDFCAGPNARWRYPARSFPSPLLPGVPMQHMSLGDWAACEECHALIEANEIDNLVTRSVDSQLAQTDLDMRQFRPQYVRFTNALYERFFEHRDGEATLIAEGDET